MANVKCSNCGKEVTDLYSDFFGGKSEGPLCDECYQKEQKARAAKEAARQAENQITTRNEPEEDTIFPQ